MYTVSDLKDSVAGQLSGIDLNNVPDLYGSFERAARLFVQRAKIPETQGTQNILIYDGVTDYLSPTSMFGTGIMDIRPQGVSRGLDDFVYKKLSDDFDRAKLYKPRGTMATFAYSLGIPVIRIVSSHTTPRIILDSMSSLTGWSYNASVNNVILDTSWFYQSPASIRFGLAGSGSPGYFEKTINPLDLTGYVGIGVAFLAIELPTTDFTTFELRIGSDSSNYYSVTNTTGTLGNVVGEFMLVAFDLSLATTVGTPDITKIQYLRVVLNYNTNAQTNVRIGGLFISLPMPMQVLYSSAGFFKLNGVVSTTITGVTDEIILNDAAFTIYQFECAMAVLQNTGASAADATSAMINGILNSQYTRTGKIMTVGLYDLYRGENPSQELRSSGSYYDPGPGYDSIR